MTESTKLDIMEHLTISFLLTRRCNAQCRHCGAWPASREPGSKSEADSDFTTTDLHDFIDQIAETPAIEAVGLTGGEVFIVRELLYYAVERLREKRIPYTVVTNAFWAKTLETAKEVLSDFKDTIGIGLSADTFHNEFIPFAKVKGVIEAARQIGIGVFPWVSEFIDDLSRLDAAGTHTLTEFESLFGRNYVMHLPQRYWIHMGGRALETFRPYLADKSARQIIDKNAGGCSSELLSTGHFHLDLFGNYIPGLCSGLSIKREDLGNTLSEDRYPILTTLFHEGICGIYKLAKEKFEFTPSRNRYINKCDLCTEIRKVFTENHFGGAAELNPRAFYDNI